MSPLAAARSQPGERRLFEDAAGDIAGQLRILPAEDREDGGRCSGSRSKTLAPLGPRFVSVTYGAGGSTRERTHATVARILRETALHAAAHLTCVDASRGEIDEIARAYWDAGMRHIVALRGDPPEPGKPFAPHPDGYANAAELVAGLKKVAPFEISVACLSRMPSGFAHRGRRPRQSQAQDRRRRRPGDHASSSSRRAASSASATRSPRPASTAEIMPGILPVSNVAQTRKFAAHVRRGDPALAGPAVRGAGRSARRAPARRRHRRRRALRASSMRAACAQFHFYTLNRAELAYAICHLLGLRPKDRTSERPPNSLGPRPRTRILIKDGAYGTQIQARKLGEADYRGALDARRATRRAITTS